MTARPPSQTRRAALAVAALVYLGFALASQRTLVRHPGSQVYHQAMLGQDCLLHAYLLAWDHHALATAPCEFTDANVLFPNRHTLLYSDHLLGLAVLVAPLRLFTDNVILVHNLATLAAPVLNGVAAAALALDLTGRAPAALVAGALYGFAPMRLFLDRCQIQMLVAWWLPLLLLWGERATRGEGRRWGVLAGLALAFQGLTGIYLTAFFLPFLALAHLWWRWRHPPRGDGGWAALLGAEAAAVVLLLPLGIAYHGVQTALGAHRSPLLNAILSLQPALLGDLVPPWTLGLLTAAGLLVGRRASPRFRDAFPVLVAITLGGFVLALGPAVTLPRGFGTVWGPYTLLLSLPGYTALRVPGRCLHVALLGASVLAAGGVAALSARWPRPAAAALAVAVLAAGAIERRPPAFPTVPIPAPRALDPIYGWLATQPDSVRLVELPVDPLLVLTAYRQYASTLHWKPMLDGTMGIAPPSFPYMQRELVRFPAPDVVRDLRALGITHAVVHLDQLADADRERVQAAARERRLLKPRRRIRKTVVYALRSDVHGAPRAPTGHPLPRDGWRIDASANPADVAHAIDDDPTTSWSSWGELERGLRVWYDPRPLLARWAEFLTHQPIGFTIGLPAPAPVTGVVLRLAGSDPLFLSEITVESSPDGRQWTPLPGRLEALPDARDLVDHAADPTLGVVLDAPVEARALRFSGDGFEWRVGDVQVYSR